MTDKTFHCRATGLTLPAFSAAGDPLAGRVLSRGETFTVSAETYELTKDRLGNSWLDLTEQEQTQRWGMIRFLPGPAPEDIIYADDDEYFNYLAGTRARDQALAVSHPVERAEALAAVERKYGKALHPVAQSSQVLPG